MRCVLFLTTLAVLWQGLVCNGARIRKSSYTSSSSRSKAGKVICNVSGKAENYLGGGKFTLDKLDVQLCDTIRYFDPVRVVLDSDVMPIYSDEDVGKLTVSRIAKLKAKRSDLKFILDMNLSVDEALIKKIRDNNLSFEAYAKKLTERINEYTFDGFVFQFLIDGVKPDAETIKSFTKACSAAFKKENLLRVAYSELPDMLLAESYKHFDYVMINAGTYDYIDTHLRVLQPIYPRPAEVDLEKIRNIEWFVKYYINLGFPRSKILLDINTDGKTYKVLDGKRKLGSPVKERGFNGPLSGRTSNVAYFELCELLSEDGWKTKNLEDGSYSYNKTSWISHESRDSLKLKAQYIKDNGIGAWIGSLNLDDHSGKFCGQGKYPLTKAFLSVLNDY